MKKDVLESYRNIINVPIGVKKAESLQDFHNRSAEVFELCGGYDLHSYALSLQMATYLLLGAYDYTGNTLEKAIKDNNGPNCRGATQAMLYMAQHLPNHILTMTYFENNIVRNNDKLVPIWHADVLLFDFQTSDIAWTKSNSSYPANILSRKENTWQKYAQQLFRMNPDRFLVAYETSTTKANDLDLRLEIFGQSCIRWNKIKSDPFLCYSNDQNVYQYVLTDRITGIDIINGLANGYIDPDCIGDIGPLFCMSERIDT